MHSAIDIYLSIFKESQLKGSIRIVNTISSVFIDRLHFRRGSWNIDNMYYWSSKGTVESVRSDCSIDLTRYNGLHTNKHCVISYNSTWSINQRTSKKNLHYCFVYFHREVAWSLKRRSHVILCVSVLLFERKVKTSQAKDFHTASVYGDSIILAIMELFFFSRKLLLRSIFFRH